MYFTTEEFRASQEQEETVWGKLGFVNGLNRFTPLDVHELSILLAEAHYRNFRAQLDILRGHQWAGRLHLTAANPDSVEKMAHAKKIDCPALVEGDPKR
jgi:hypothetical protein